MYVPPAFREDDRDSIHAAIRSVGLATLVTATDEGLIGTPLPLFLAPDEGAEGTLYGHVAKANPQWRLAPQGDALAIFAGPDAYVSAGWYPSKQEHGKVVPTWNYAAVHAYGTVEFFHEPERLHAVVTRLTALHEAAMAKPWAVADAPEPFVAAQLRGIVGVRMAITRLQGKSKMSQNRNAADRAGVVEGLQREGGAQGEAVAARVRSV